MTRDELHIAFKIEMDKNSKTVAYGGCPAFLDEEIDYWLMKGYYQVIATKFTGNNNLKIPFEGSVKRISDLERLVNTDKNISVQKEENSNCIILSNLLSRDGSNQGRMFFVQAELIWNNGEDHRAIVELTDHNIINNFKQTYNNVPWIERPKAVIQDNSLIIYIDPIDMTGDFTLDLTYVKFPTPITELPSEEGLTEVPEYVQSEIVDKAVQLALDNIESQRIQTKSQLNLISE